MKKAVKNPGTTKKMVPVEVLGTEGLGTGGTGTTKSLVQVGAVQKTALLSQISLRPRGILGNI